MTGYLIIALFALGIWGLLSRRNLIKKVIALNLINTALVLMYLYLGSLSGNAAPILVAHNLNIVDPIPQALMLTAIVVGVCVTSLALVLSYKIYQHYHTHDITHIEMMIRRDDA